MTDSRWPKINYYSFNPGSRVVPDRKKEKSEKHKTTLGRLLQEE